MQHIPQQRLAHQTLGVQRLAVRAEDYWDYKPEQRVQTCDGFPGTVTAVLDGPHPGTEEYQVTLDGGMGGGAYTASQLSPAPTVTAAAGTAGADYPELAQVLVDRPDPALHHVYASSKPPWVKDDDSDDDSDSDDDEDDDGSDSGTDSDDDDDPDDDDSGKDGDKDSDDDSDDDSDKDDDDNAPPWAKKKASLFDSMIRTAAVDADFRFHITAAWSDVVAKAKRIRSEGGVRVTLASEGILFAEVKGDTNVYETGLQRLPGRTGIASYSCGCVWASYHWGADDDFSRFAGRLCSHALALQYEAQSRGMFGRDINADEHKPTWVPRKVVIRYDIDSGQNQLVRSSVKVAAWDDPEPDMWDMHYGEDPHAEDKKAEWDNIHSGLDGIHRGLGVHLHPDDHAIVHDESRPLAERAHHLLKSLPRSIHGNENVGVHWTSDDGVGESFGETGSQNTAKHYPTGQMREGTSVVLHAHTPERSDIDENPDESKGEVYGYHDHGEREVPLHPGASVHLQGISWKPMHDVHDHEGNLVEEHHDRDYTRHDFHGGGHWVSASLQQPSADAPLHMLARAAVAAGEDREEVLLALRVVGSVSSPFGEPSSGTSYQLPHAPGATKPRRASDNPASSGPFIGADPVGWQSALPTGSLDDRLGAVDSALFEPGGAEAELHDEPEGALPATDGVSIPSDDEALTPSMTASLSKRALKDFSLAEQQALINEGEGVRAANLDRLQIEGTHYAELEGVLAAADDDTTWMA